MALTALQEKKMSRRFALLDTDHSGYVDEDDYSAMAERLIAGCEGASDSAAQAVRDSYKELCRALLLSMDADGDGRISEAEFKESIATLISSDGYDASIDQAAQAVLAMYDADGSGELDRDEFGRVFASYGVDADDIDQAFRRIDSDGSGSLSTDEIAGAAKAFYTSDDPDAAGNWLFGGI